MKKENKIEKKLSLKKLQLTKLNFVRGAGGSGVAAIGNDNGTNGDTTTSKNCQKGLDTAL